MFEHDSWSHWIPDPDRAFREHDPSLEPFASMTRDEVLDAMREARGGHHWEFLLEFLLDKCAERERDAEHILGLLAGRGGMGIDELYLLGEHACMATRLVHAVPTAALGRVDVGLDPQAVPGGSTQPPSPYHCFNGSDRL